MRHVSFVGASHNQSASSLPALPSVSLPLSFASELAVGKPVQAAEKLEQEAEVAERVAGPAVAAAQAAVGRWREKPAW